MNKDNKDIDEELERLREEKELLDKKREIEQLKKQLGEEHIIIKVLKFMYKFIKWLWEAMNTPVYEEDEDEPKKKDEEEEEFDIFNIEL